MVKQGSFASVSSVKQLGQFKQRTKLAESQAIQPEQIKEFLVVRYHLTQNARLAPVTKETMQRFLMAWLDNATAQTWALTTITQQTLGQIATQVPWQFYALVNSEWRRFQKFLQKEVPAMPLVTRRLVTAEAETITALVAQQLALNWFLTMYAAMPDRLAAVTEQQVADLQQSLLIDDQINWQNVATVYSTAPFVMPTDVDEGTVTWLQTLTDLTADQLK